MIRPSAKLYADYFSEALRPPGGLRHAALLHSAAHERPYTTGRRALTRADASLSDASSGYLVCQGISRLQPSVQPTRYQALRGRGLGTVRDRTGTREEPKEVQDGPLKEYDSRVLEGRLRDDSYQRGRQLLPFSDPSRCQRESKLKK